MLRILTCMKIYMHYLFFFLQFKSLCQYEVFIRWCITDGYTHYINVDACRSGDFLCMHLKSKDTTKREVDVFNKDY